MYTGEKPVHLPRVLRGLIPRVSNANNCDHNSENKARVFIQYVIFTIIVILFDFLVVQNLLRMNNI